MAKREVVMCDKNGCNTAAGGQCALCDQDVCVETHAVQATLGYQTADHAHPQIPLPFLICRTCGSATRSGTREIVSTTEDRGTTTREEAVFGPEKWPADMIEKLQPLFEVIRAAMAEKALEKGNDNKRSPFAGEPTTKRHTLSQGEVVVRNKTTGIVATVNLTSHITASEKQGHIEILNRGPNT